MKIVYCTDTICHPGGIQTVTMVKANALASIPDNQVWIIVTEKITTPMIELSDVHFSEPSGILNCSVYKYRNSNRRRGRMERFPISRT